MSATPGPWQRRGGVGQYTEEVVAVSSRGREIVVARVASGIAHRAGDAALISIAPDMRELLAEAQHLLKHTNCIDDDASKCEACSLESRIETLLARVRKEGP